VNSTNIHIVGVNHGHRYFNLLRNSLVSESMQNILILGLEGIVRSTKSEEIIGKQLRYPTKSFYGIEKETSLSASHMLKFYYDFTNPKEPYLENMRDSATHLLVELSNPLLSSAWQKLMKYPIKDITELKKKS
jgi:hypothetical protein